MGRVKHEHIGAIIVERAWAEQWMFTAFHNIGLKDTVVGGVTIYQIPKNYQ